MLNEKRKNNFISIIILAISGIFLYLFSSTFIGSSIRKVTSYIYSPVSYYSMSAGRNSNRYFNLFTSISSFRKEYEDLKLQIATLKANSDALALLENENNLLKKQLKLGSKDDTIVSAKVIGFDQTSNILYINLGKNDGIHEGSVAIVGNIYIGVVASVDNDTSKIILSHNRDFFAKGVVVRSVSPEISIDNINKNAGARVANVVIVGRGDYCAIENIPVGTVKEGDLILMNDSRFKKNYLLGTVKDIDRDLAASTQTAKIDEYLNPAELNSLFIVK